LEITDINFWIAGFRKAGTTLLAAALKNHPEIHMSVSRHTIKNAKWNGDDSPPREFDNRLCENNILSGFLNEKIPHGNFGKLDIDISYPLVLFETFLPADEDHQGKMVGFKSMGVERQEILNIYKKLNPNMKVICVVRDPIERIESAWAMNAPQPKHKIHKFDIGGINGYLDYHFDTNDNLGWNELQYSRYKSLLSSCFANFDTLIISLEELISKPGFVAERVCDFLDIDSGFKLRNSQLSDLTRYSRADYNNFIKINDYHRARLCTSYREDVEFVSQYADTTAWKNFT